MTTKADERLARIETAIDRLEALGLSGPSPAPSSVNPDGSPGHVASGELIESAWGNAVVDEFNRGRAVFKQVSTGASFGLATPQDFPGLSISATVAAGRVYRISAFVSSCIATLDDVRTLYIVNQLGQTINRAVFRSVDNAFFSMYASVISTTAAGAVSYKVMMSSAAGVLTVVGSTSQQSYIMLEEISRSVI